MQDTEKRSALERFLWENKITHATLAEESGVSRTTIWQLIKGNITEEPKKAVVAALRVLCVRRGIEYVDPFQEDGE